MFKSSGTPRVLHSWHVTLTPGDFISLLYQLILIVLKSRSNDGEFNQAIQESEPENLQSESCLGLKFVQHLVVLVSIWSNPSNTT